MRSLAIKNVMPEEAPEDDTPEPARPSVIWVYGSLVCVTIVDESTRAHESACRCGGCHASRQADVAALFL